MITISKNDAVESIRMLLHDYYWAGDTGWKTEQDRETLKEVELELLNGAQWWIERHNGWNLPNVTRGVGSCGDLESEDLEFCKRWADLNVCKSLDDAPEEFLAELLQNLGTVAWLMN